MLKTLMSRMLLMWGLVFCLIGYSWIAAPTASRLAGISWVPIPLNEQVVGTAWLLAGIFALVGAFVRRSLPPLAIVPAFIPLLVALIFLGSYVDSWDVNRLVSVVSYAGMGLSIVIVGSTPGSYVDTRWYDLGDAEKSSGA